MLSTRLASIHDLDFLWSMLFYAAHADEQPEATVDSIRHDPDLDRYLCDWGRPGDLGLIATDDDVSVGAAWLRLFTPDETHLVSYVAADVPELAIAIDPQRVGQGIGSRLVGDLLQQADQSGVPAIVLTARADNPAVRLYHRFGFVEIDRITNRVGTGSVKMVRERNQ